MGEYRGKVIRLVVVALVCLLVMMSFVAARMALRDPLIIERACYSSPLEPKSPTHTTVEMDAFVKEVVHQRFDSNSNPSMEFMALEEFKIRENEQTELSRRKIGQTIVVNSWTKKDDTIVVNADRLISVGAIRSALPFPLTLQLSSTPRSQSNPYGLVLVKVTSTDKGESNEAKK